MMIIPPRSRSNSVSSVEGNTDSALESPVVYFGQYEIGNREWGMLGSHYRSADMYTDHSSVTAATTPASSVSDPTEHLKEPREIISPAPALDITVGVELELILHSPSKSITLAELYPLLRSSLSPLAALLSTTVPDLQVAHHPHPETVFQVKTDDTISTNPWPNSLPIEIATPILYGSSWEWVLPAVCSAVKSLPGTEVRVNHSTGLHVHVGLGRPYTLLELKRLAKAVVLLEEAMDANHPKHRIPEEAMGSCYRSVIGNLVFRGCSGKAGMVKLIDDCQSTEELLGVLNASAGRGSGHCRLYKYNFTAMLDYGTVEFRQAAGTACGGRVVEWVRCVVAFVREAVGTEEDKWKEWARDGVPKEVWRMFGAPSEPGWGRRCRERGRGKGRRRNVPMKYRLKKRARSVWLARQRRT